MLLAGIKFDTPALDFADIDAVKNKAKTTGRSFGGAPLRNGSNGYGGDRGRINYADARANPFANHIPAGYVPPPHISNRDGYGRQPYPQQGYHQNYSQHSYPPTQSYGQPHYPPQSNYGPPPGSSYSRGHDKPERPLPEGYGYNRPPNSNGYGNRY
jgi:5'-3' exoribonuclease 2